MYNVNYSSDPRKAAEDVLHMHWDGALPIRVDDIARRMGLQVIKRTSPEFQYSGYFRDASNSEHGIPLIEFNGYDSFTRQRFTIAHELGHYVLRHGTSPRDYPNSFTTGTKDPRERAANQFAAEILMPADTVHQVVMSGYASSIDEIANLFGVSTLAMGYRLDNIGLLL
jgi:Zn-dependent peptidase ImmA (M78 family)